MNTTSLNAQKQCLYTVEWQTLRVQLLGTWTDDISVGRNTARLVSYIQKGVPINSSKESSVLRTRYWQVLNLLNAVRMSNHGTGHVHSSADKIIVGFQGWCSVRYTEYTFRGADFILPTKEEILSDLPFAGAWVKPIRDDLRKRVVTAIYKQTRAKSREEAERLVRANRPELFWFLDILEQYLKERKSS